MNLVLVALAANFSSILSLQGLNIDGPIGLGVTVGETSSDAFVLWGTLDSAAVDDTNAWNLGTFTGGAQNLPPEIAAKAKMWPYLLVQRTGGSTAGSFVAAGDPAANPAVVSATAPVVVGNYSGLITLTTLAARNVRLGLSAAMTEADVFDVYLSNDSALATSAGAFYAGRICGGGGDGALLNSVLFKGYNYARVARVEGSTAGNVLAAGVSPSAGGGVLNLTVLAVGDTAVSGPIGALTAAASVDIYSAFVLTQTTASVDATLPAPTITTAGKFAYVFNNDTSAQSITMYGENLSPGSGHWFFWDGTVWGGDRAITQNGNAFGTALRIGTLDNQNVVIGRNGINILSATATALVLGDTTGAYATTIQGGTGGIPITPTGAGPVALSGSLIQGASGVAAIADGTGSLGAAAATVDLTSVLYVNQTTPVVLYANMRTIAPPTTTTAGRKLTIVNVGTAAFIVGDATQKQGVNLIPGTTPGGAASADKGQSCTFTWNGTAWVPDDTGPGVPVVAAGLADASASIPRAGRYTVYRAATWAQNGTLTASLTGALIGDIIDIVRDDGTQANTMTVNNAAAAALVVAPASKKATIRIGYLGSGDWQLLGGGAF